MFHFSWNDLTAKAQRNAKNANIQTSDYSNMQTSNYSFLKKCDLCLITVLGELRMLGGLAVTPSLRLPMENKNGKWFFLKPDPRPKT